MPESAERSPPNASTALPAGPIHHIVSPLRRFLHVEAASGVVLLLWHRPVLTPPPDVATTA